MTPPPPPPPPPPSFFSSSYHHNPQQHHHHHRQQQPMANTKTTEKLHHHNHHHHHHHRSGSSSHISEFDSSKLQKLSSSSSSNTSQKCLTLEHGKSKQQQQQQQQKYQLNGELKRSNRPRSSHNINCSSLSINKDHQQNSAQNHEPSPAICQQTQQQQQQQPNGHYSKPKIYQQNQHNAHHQQYSNNNKIDSSLMRQKSDQSEQVIHCESNNKVSNNKNNTEQLSIFDGSKKSRCILFSQIYLITHISITICLNENRESLSKDFIGSISKNLILDLYVLYILIASLIYFILLRFYAVPKFIDNLTFNELTEQTPILFGAIILGFSELAQCVLELIDCLESESIILPAAKFVYHIAFMHFLLTQIIYSNYIGLRNIAIAHLLSTQISLWMLSGLSRQQTLQRKHHCDYKLDLSMLKMLIFHDDQNYSNKSEKNLVLDLTNSSKIIIDEQTNSMIEPEPFQISLFILNNQFKFLSIFILITMWFSNNQSKINFIRAKLSEEEVIRSSCLNPESRSYLFRGFMVGSVFLVTAVLSIVFYENKIFQYSASIFIQVMITVISLCGLVIRRRQIDSNDPKYQINILKYHFIPFVTLFLVYIVSLMNLLNFLKEILAKKDKLFNSTIDSTSGSDGYATIIELILPVLSSISYLTLIIQVTIQSYLLRLQGKKLVTMTHVFSLLAISNFALWMIDVSSIISDRHLWPVQWYQHHQHQHPQNYSNSSTTTLINTINNSNNNNKFLSINSNIVSDHDNELIKWYNLNDNDYYLKNILTMFVPLNRYYCSLIFFHFWKLKI